MSLSWHERIVVGLAPERLSALSVGGLGRRRLLDRHAVTLHDQDAGEWEAGVNALEALLEEPAWHGRRIVIVLSAHYVRHVILPGQGGLTDAARLTLAGLMFRNTFGDLARDWEIRVAPTGAGQPALACGVPRSLLAALRTACDRRGRLQSIQPSLMPVFNRIRRDIGRSVGCIALVEPGRVSLAFVERGEWTHIDSRAGGGHSLPELLLEESVLHERQPGGILWLCDLTEAASLPAEAFWTQRRIAAPPLHGFDSRASLAIWGVT